MVNVFEGMHRPQPDKRSTCLASIRYEQKIGRTRISCRSHAHRKSNLTPFRFVLGDFPTHISRESNKAIAWLQSVRRRLGKNAGIGCAWTTGFGIARVVALEGGSGPAFAAVESLSRISVRRINFHRSDPSKSKLQLLSLTSLCDAIGMKRAGVVVTTSIRGSGIRFFEKLSQRAGNVKITRIPSRLSIAGALEVVHDLTVWASRLTSFQQTGNPGASTCTLTRFLPRPGGHTDPLQDHARAPTGRHR